MSINRWDLRDEVMSFRDAVDRMLRDSFFSSRPDSSSTPGSIPLDVQETEDEYIVKATMPGVKPEDVKLHVTGDTLQISGEIKDESRQEQKGEWLLRERRFGRFQRTITLPMVVHADSAEADFEHGVLNIRLPKSQDTRPRSIAIRSAQGSRSVGTESTSQSSQSSSASQSQSQSHATAQPSQQAGTTQSSTHVTMPGQSDSERP